MESFLGEYLASVLLLIAFRSRSYAEPEQTGVEEFYDKFTNILNGDIFHRGQWSYQTVLSSSSSWRLMAWKWTFNGNKVLIVINYRYSFLSCLLFL